jgi:nitric oxide synthase oxygenase domain/subunit
MTSRVIDLRLRNLEQKASQSALSHLTDAQLDAQILGTLSIVAAPPTAAMCVP